MDDAAPDLFGPEEDESPGWTALEHAFAAMYPGQEPLSFGPIIQYEQGGPDPLEGLAVYRSEQPAPHWHYVTFGFSELHGKSSPDPEVSGFGFELSLRLRRDEGQSAPSWPLDLLQSLARYVFTSGNAFDENHHMDLDGPLMPELATEITAIALRTDPVFATLSTPNGRVKILQVVGLTPDELEAVRAWDPHRFLTLLEEHQPALILDIERGSLLSDLGLSEEVAQRIERDGSSQEAAFVPSLSWSLADGALRIALDEGAASNMLRLVRGRLLFGRPFTLVRGEDQAIEVAPGERWSFRPDPLDPYLMRIGVPETLAAGFLRDVTGPGSYRWPEAPELVLEVEALG